MSRSYSIEYAIMHPLTEEVAYNMLKKVEMLGGAFSSSYRNADLALPVLLKEGSVECDWQQEEPEHELALVQFRLTKIDDQSFEFAFQPGSANRWGSEWGSLGIDFKWYVEKSLAISNPLPIASLTAQLNDSLEERFKEWTIHGGFDELAWYFGPPYFNKPSKLSHHDWIYMAQYLDKLIANGAECGCVFEPYILDEATLAKDALFLKGTTAEREDIIAKIQCGDLWLMPSDPQFKPQNIRPYLELMAALWKGFGIWGVQADSLAVKLG